jgi:integrase
MRNNNAANERIKHRYFAYLHEAKRLGDSSIDSVAAALHRFEIYTRYREFKAFHPRQAVAFKRYLAEQLSQRSGGRLSNATRYSMLPALRNFFVWLAGQPGFRSHLTYSDADYFNASEKDARIAKAHRDPPAPTLDQLRHVLACMPAISEIERRDRAVMALTMLTGARDGAIISLRIKHINLSEDKVIFDAREVKTKFAKSFTTWFFPVGDDIRQIIAEWLEYLLRERLFGLDDPLFPATDVALDADHRFAPAGLSRRHWSNATPIRIIFRSACTRADLPYFTPHSVRKTIAVLGEKCCHTPEQFKAWSQNLGHDQVLTTFSSYGAVSASRQSEIIRQLAECEDVDDREMQELAKELVKAAKRKAG